MVIFGKNMTRYLISQPIISRKVFPQLSTDMYMYNTSSVKKNSPLSWKQVLILLAYREKNIPALRDTTKF